MEISYRFFVVYTPISLFFVLCPSRNGTHLPSKQPEDEVKVLLKFMANKELSITIIDDDEIAHYLVSVFLKRELPTATIRSFLSATEFLSVFDAGSFKTDGILLDISMPKMTGWELAERLKKTSFDIPVHILSSSADSRDLQRIGDFSFIRSYIVKPLTVEKLREFLADVVRK